MPRKISTPKLCHHQKSGRAYVTIDGKQRYLGPHGSPQATEAYERLLGQWFANGRSLVAPSDAVKPASDFTITELVAGFWEHAQKHYRKPDGTPTGECAPFKSALKMLRKSHGSIAVTDFGPLAMKAVRQSMIAAGWTRRNINRQVARIRQVFRWGVSNEVVPAATLTALEAVEPLQRGRSEAKEAPPVEMVDERDVEAVKPFVSSHVWAMIQLQLLTGMRPGEVCIMRMRDITVAKDGDGREYWTYNMPQHKTSHHGKARTVTMYEAGINIIRPFVTTSTEAYFFSPSNSEAVRNAAKMKHADKAAFRRAWKRGRPPGERYTVDSYRRAIARGCDKADAAAKRAMAEAGQKVPTERIIPKWHPHQLRHTAATRIREANGAEAAAVMLGHSKIDMTLEYAKRTQEMQRKTAAGR